MIKLKSYLYLKNKNINSFTMSQFYLRYKIRTNNNNKERKSEHLES